MSLLQAAKQALEALLDAQDTALTDMCYHDEITALRQAIAQAEQKPIRNEFIRERQQLEQEWCELRKLQAAYKTTPQPKAEQQEPNYFGLTHDHTWLSIDKKQYDKLKPEGRMACYAAPVRTKDLTNDEIAEIHGCPPAEWVVHFAHAVIAADREKNK